MRQKNTRRLLLMLLTVIAVALAACGGEDSATTGQSPAEDAAPGTYTTVDVQQAHAALSANPDAIMVDVRTEQEWATTGVPRGAALITLDDIRQRAGELPKNEPVYLICNSGNRSQVAAQTLVELGFTSVYNVAGGIQAWLRADLPTEVYTP